MMGLFMLDLIMLVIYLFQNLIMQLPNNSIIKKPYYRQYVDFTMAGFVDALSPDKSVCTLRNVKLRSISGLLCCMHGKRGLVFQ